MTEPKPRPGILDIAPYVGGEAQIPGVKRAIKLASNESALGPSPKAIAAYRKVAKDLHRYPDGGADRLRGAIAERYGLEPAQIVCGAGSDELIAMLCRAYAGPGDEVLYSEFGFLMYAISAKSAGATPVKAPERDYTAHVDSLLARVNERTRLLFLANPNNPTGTYLANDELARLRQRLSPQVLLVIDAAYAEYVDRNDYSPGVDLVRNHPNVVMTRTFSKIYGLAALRLGWAYCPPAVADVLHRVRGPFNVGAAAQAAGLAAIADHAHTAGAKEHNDHWRPWLMHQLAAIGLSTTPSVGNFVLARFPYGAPQAKAADAFLKTKGLIVRQMAGYGLPDCLRITVGLDDENEALTATLGEFMKTP